MDDKTQEEIYNELIELKEKLETFESEKQNMSKELEETKKSLDEAREINAKLYRQSVSIESRNLVDKTDETETVDSFIDSFIKPNMERMSKMYGVEFR